MLRFATQGIPQTPRLSRARRLQCLFCEEIFDRDHVYDHLERHIEDGLWDGNQPIGKVFRAAPRRTP